ncbi:class Ib ribonucleoside-diphosphate reductase assembly flavoprotein NrdI [Niallia sp. NCCP-28]|uniref:class Ib ribonucleoside-diphosphate reductase assembly flavoprotein NrdI n=1 Tax=Niallia sp. NCCP-28 TaxID=2934712 RepID=UPI0028525BC2|nr:class Ib ribonucleoside-diphosphate reductase assembly flavoprotein NrdI [Niallia sp. NCCP-28]
MFDSKTGNVRRFVQKLGLPENKVIELKAGLKVYEPYILVTYTTGMGQVPQTTLDFLKANRISLHAVAASGNRNWGQNFALSANKISTMYGVPILHKFEMSGMPEDMEIFRERVQNISYETYRIKQRSDTA